MFKSKNRCIFFAIASVAIVIVIAIHAIVKFENTWANAVIPLNLISEAVTYSKLSLSIVDFYCWFIYSCLIRVKYYPWNKHGSIEKNIFKLFFIFFRKFLKTFSILNRFPNFYLPFGQTIVIFPTIQVWLRIISSFTFYWSYHLCILTFVQTIQLLYLPIWIHMNCQIPLSRCLSLTNQSAVDSTGVFSNPDLIKGNYAFDCKLLYLKLNSAQLSSSPTFQRQSKVLVKIFEVYDLQSNLSVVIICVVALISLLFVLLVLWAILVGANVSPASFNDHMKSNIHSSVSNINKSKTLGCLNPFCRWQTKLKWNRTEQSRERPTGKLSLLIPFPRWISPMKNLVSFQQNFDGGNDVCDLHVIATCNNSNVHIILLSIVYVHCIVPA